MKVMILAAGEGRRMRPLTATTPKPLLPVAGEPLLGHHLRRLAAQGFREVVINVAYLGQHIIDYCGDGSAWGLSIAISRETAPLETAGGILQAMPLLGDAPFLVVNGDVWTDIDFGELASSALRTGEQAHLVLVDNPPQHPAGDFQLDADGWICSRDSEASDDALTYAGVGIYTPAFFGAVAEQPVGKLALRPLLDTAIAQRALGGRHHTGEWEDVGTPERLAALDARQSQV